MKFFAAAIFASAVLAAPAVGPVDPECAEHSKTGMHTRTRAHHQTGTASHPHSTGTLHPTSSLHVAHPQPLMTGAPVLERRADIGSGIMNEIEKMLPANVKSEIADVGADIAGVFETLRLHDGFPMPTRTGTHTSKPTGHQQRPTGTGTFGRPTEKPKTLMTVIHKATITKTTSLRPTHTPFLDAKL